MYNSEKNNYQNTYKLIKKAGWSWGNFWDNYKNEISNMSNNPKAYFKGKVANAYNNKIAPAITKVTYKAVKPFALGAAQAVGQVAQDEMKKRMPAIQQQADNAIKNSMATAKSQFDNHIKSYWDKFQGWSKNNAPWLGAAGGALGGALLLPLIASTFTSNKKAQRALALLGMLGMGYAGYRYGGGKFK